MEIMLYEFCGGFRGEDGNILSLKGILEFRNEARRHPITNVMLNLRDRFKNRVRRYMAPATHC